MISSEWFDKIFRPEW